MKTVPFTKMHGLGNDFVIINVHDLPVHPKELPITQLANRYLGIGFDQLLLVTPKQKMEEFFCQIFNADGSEAEQCGNGLRCVARYVNEEKLFDGTQVVISTIAGNYTVRIRDYDYITVNMGVPTIREKAVPIDQWQMSIVDVGNPHAIVNVGQVNDLQINDLADKIAKSDYFPHGVNVGFVELVDKNHIRLRTFERGAGETLACGSNACAAAIAGISNKWVNSPVEVEYAYGMLEVRWPGENQPVELTGPAARVYSGVFAM